MGHVGGWEAEGGAGDITHWWGRRWGLAARSEPCWETQALKLCVQVIRGSRGRIGIQEGPPGQGLCACSTPAALGPPEGPSDLVEELPLEPEHLLRN